MLKEYAPALIKRAKWNQREETIENYDLVWILEDLTPRGLWNLGKVVEKLTGPDGIAANKNSASGETSCSRIKKGFSDFTISCSTKP